jgi:hypothetical protein
MKKKTYWAPNDDTCRISSFGCCLGEYNVYRCLYPPPRHPSSSGASPAMSLAVPPAIHPPSSCLWGCGQVVCHLSPWTGGSGVGVGVGAGIGVLVLSSMLVLSLSLSCWLGAGCVCGRSSWRCWGGGGEFWGGGVSRDVAHRWVEVGCLPGRNLPTGVFRCPSVPVSTASHPV